MEGKIKSSPLPVTSGVPQCSIIVPLLFMLCINDIFDVCTSIMKLYADNVCRLFAQRWVAAPTYAVLTFNHHLGVHIVSLGYIWILRHVDEKRF